MATFRINSAGQVQILHPETGAYVPFEAGGGSSSSTSSSFDPSEIIQMSAKLPASVGAKVNASSLSVALATDSTIFSSLTNLLAALSDGGSNSALTHLNSLVSKLPASVGAKVNASSLSVALATDSTIFASLTNLLAALSDGGSNSALTHLNSLVSKLPASVGAKLRTESLSVALATDSTIFASLTNLLAALSDGGSNSALIHLNSLVSKLPASVGAKVNASSLSVALATDSTIFASLTNLLAALSDGGSNSALTHLNSLVSKLPASVGAKLRTGSLSVALATDSTIFTSLTNIFNALSDGNVNSVYSALVALSAKLPASLGAKLRAESTSIALATDSTIFTSLANILNTLSDGGANSVYSALAALSAKLPTSLGAKLNASSLSVALGTDSTIFTSLTTLINALSDGGINSALSYLATIAGAQYWKLPGKYNSNSPILNAGIAGSIAAANNISGLAKMISLQNFFSVASATAQLMVELRISLGTTATCDKSFSFHNVVGTSYVLAAGTYPAETFLILPNYGNPQYLVHVISISSGNITIYAKEHR